MKGGIDDGIGTALIVQTRPGASDLVRCTRTPPPFPQNKATARTLSSRSRVSAQGLRGFNPAHSSGNNDQAGHDQASHQANPLPASDPWLRRQNDALKLRVLAVTLELAGSRNRLRASMPPGPVDPPGAPWKQQRISTGMQYPARASDAVALAETPGRSLERHRANYRQPLTALSADNEVGRRPRGLTRYIRPGGGRQPLAPHRPCPGRSGADRHGGHHPGRPPQRQRRGAPLPAGSGLSDQGAAQLAGAARQGVNQSRWEEIKRACSVGVVPLGPIEPL